MEFNKPGERRTEEDTLPKLLRSNYQEYGNRKVALRRKDRGIWNEYTWKDYYHHVKYFSLGLTSLGFQPGDRIAIIGDNDPEYYWAELGAQSACGSSVGIFTDSAPEEVKYIINDSESSFVVAQDQEQVDKVLSIKSEIKRVKKTIYWDPKGLWFYDDPWIMSFEAVEELGKSYEKNHPDLFEKNIDQGKGNDVAVLCYTSGTTGLPKGVILSYDNVIGCSRGWLDVDPWYPDDNYLSFLPPAWAAEQYLGIASGLRAGITVNFPETAETIQEDIREISPQCVFYASRIWEDVASTVQAKINDSTFLKRFLFRIFFPVNDKIEGLRNQKKKRNLFWKCLGFLSYIAFFRALKDKLGLQKIRAAYTAGAPLSPDTFGFLRTMEINLKQFYGTTETGINTVHRTGDVRHESVGELIPGSSIKISQDQAILLKGSAPFEGYYKKPDSTREKLTGDGWFHTGDAGHIDSEGHLIYLERLEDMRELSSGHKFPPQFIEGKLKFSPYIKDVMVVGGKERDYVTALIQIDFANMGKWAEENRIAYTTFTDLSQKPRVYDFIEKEIERVNRSLPEKSRIKKFLNLHKEFDPDDAELTRTRKLRRRFVEDRYKELIEALYSDRTEMIIESEVRYQDGRTSLIKTSLTIRFI
ncbi:MAG: AMP-binding protein [Pseudomonadota bacterium]